MITYQQVVYLFNKQNLKPPNRDLVDLYNSVKVYLLQHEKNIENTHYESITDSPSMSGREWYFNLFATKIQTDNILFCLSKHAETKFPLDMMQNLFDNIDYKIAFAKISKVEDNTGSWDGILLIYHQTEKTFNMDKVFDSLINL